MCDRMVIDAFSFRNLAAFINFSCEPNLKSQPVGAAHSSKVPRIGFYAVAPIAKGQELSYRRDSSAVRAKREGKRCYCGAKLCKGTL
jgi:SET domain-containing protein